MESKHKKSVIRYEEQCSKVMDVFNAVSNLDALPDENDGNCQSVTSEAYVEDEYPTLVEIVFPKECWELHGWSSIVVPVGEVLRWVANEDPHYGPDFEAIRSDFYPENSDAYDCWDLDPDINWRPDDKRMAEIRAELEAKAELRRRQDM
ncbi:hypothetical protein ACLB6G_20585 [Zhengella sp. ZM62]|uniref:hypothetical protein n=1 Tax=Zhengella sedimenti TaxID=3390035 RepID=UPI003974A5F8